MVTTWGRDSGAARPGHISPGTHCSPKSEWARGPFTFPGADCVWGTETSCRAHRGHAPPGEEKDEAPGGGSEGGTGHGPCVSWGCPNQTADGQCKQSILPHRCRGCKSEFKVPSWLGSGESLLLGPFLLCPRVAFLTAHLQGRRATWGLFLL